MTVLVMNEEMVDYLQKLIRSVGARGLPVSTMALFCRKLCREGGTLMGRTVHESQLLSDLKHHPLAFSATWAGLLKSVEEFWRKDADGHFKHFRDVNVTFADDLIKRLGQWQLTLSTAREPTRERPAPNLADVVRRWQVEMERLIPDPNIQPTVAEKRRSEFALMKQLMEKFGQAIFDRRRLVDSMLATAQGGALLKATGHSLDGEVVAEWRRQTNDAGQRISEGDLLLHARLAAHLTLLPGETKGLAFGGSLPELTHIVIDEAQDIAVDHVKLARTLLHADGTLTLVGDLRQRVTHNGYFKDWTELDLGKCHNAVFSVNHRQSQPLGAFVANLHECLFGVVPSWRPSKRKRAPKPRIRPKRGYGGLASLVAEEIAHWRQKIANATVGVIYHGQQWNSAKKFARKIEDALGKTLTQVRVASTRESGNLNRTDCAIIASVEVTKGLEFDAVVFIDRHQIWTGKLETVDMVAKNGLYVACSRAKQGLSIIADDRCELLYDGLKTSLMEVIPVTREREEDLDDEDFMDDTIDDAD